VKPAAGSLEYAHARMWARWGARADDALWQRLEVTRELGALLDLARGSALGPWVEGITPGATLHAIEHRLRRHRRERIDELAAWMPPAWHGAIRWCDTWPELPLIEHLARGGAAPGWLAGDPRLHPLQRPGAAPGREAAAAASPDADLLCALRGLLDAARADPSALPAQLLALWRERWFALLPATGRGPIERDLVPLLALHARNFAAPETADGWAQRRALQTRLVALWRRAALEPLSAFVYVVLTGLEFERLRGELLTRAAFPHRALAR
jgi:hypothetical protein